MVKRDDATARELLAADGKEAQMSYEDTGELIGATYNKSVALVSAQMSYVDQVMKNIERQPLKTLAGTPVNHRLLVWPPQLGIQSTTYYGSAYKALDDTESVQSVLICIYIIQSGLIIQ